MSTTPSKFFTYQQNGTWSSQEGQTNKGQYEKKKAQGSMGLKIT